MSECLPCQDLQCELDDYFTRYKMQDSFIPVSSASFFNNPVYYAYSCPEGETLEINVTLPSWITYDEATLRFVGAAGTFSSTSPIAANAVAQGQLADYIDAQIALGTIVCEEPVFEITWAFADTTFNGNAIAASGAAPIVVVGTVASGNNIAQSTDGDAYVNQVSGTSNTLLGIAFGGGQFVAVGNGIFTSPTGTAWTTRAASLASLGNAICYDGSNFLYVNNLGTANVSSDGITWTPHATGTGRQLYGVVYGGATYVAVGRLGDIVSSADGITWTPHALGLAGNLTAVAYGAGLFVAVGITGKIYTSPDGATWTLRVSGTTNGFRCVTFGVGYFMAGTDTGKIFQSTDGITWAMVEDTSIYWISGFAYYGAGKFRYSGFIAPT